MAKRRIMSRTKTLLPEQTEPKPSAYKWEIAEETGHPKASWQTDPGLHWRQVAQNSGEIQDDQEEKAAVPDDEFSATGLGQVWPLVLSSGTAQ